MIAHIVDESRIILTCMYIRLILYCWSISHHINSLINTPVEDVGLSLKRRFWALVYSLGLKDKSLINSFVVSYKSRVLCCPLWICFMWIILINCIGVVLCAHKIAICKKTTHDRLNHTIKHYRSIPKYKHFIDNLQWSLKCCGVSDMFS